MPLQCKALPPAADLWERYSFNPLTGQVFSRLHPKRRALGTVKPRAGHLETHIRWNNKSQCVQIHRLVWKWVTGQDPVQTIDHINRITADNRIWNLREADWALQMKNRDYSNPNLHLNAFKLGNTSNKEGRNGWSPGGKFNKQPQIGSESV